MMKFKLMISNRIFIIRTFRTHILMIHLYLRFERSIAICDINYLLFPFGNEKSNKRSWAQSYGLHLRFIRGKNLTNI